MGLIQACCNECGKEFQWFTGGACVCDECLKSTEEGTSMKVDFETTKVVAEYMMMPCLGFVPKMLFRFISPIPTVWEVTKCPFVWSDDPLVVGDTIQETTLRTFRAMIDGAANGQTLPPEIQKLRDLTEVEVHECKIVRKE